jgi:DNA mismatch repair ATPase MutS
LYTLLASQSETGSGISRFDAEIKAIKKLISHLKNTQNCDKKNSFILLDEIFTGTNPYDGEKAAQEFLKYFLHHKLYSNSLMILSTHYREVTTIAKYHHSCGNYKINVVRNSDNSITRLFTISQGISEIPIAFDLLKQEEIISV